MISIDRSRVPAPKILKSSRARSLHREAAAHFRSEDTEAVQTRFRMDTKILNHPSVRKTLAALFNGKCAYCESRVDTTGSGDLEHFRPKAGAVDLEGNYYLAHYWWLTFEWRNLYLSCQLCNHSKRDRFPLTGPRAALETPYEDLDGEQPILLDPCVDKPGKFLVFDENGSVGSEHERGQITIEIFDLNRAGLIKMRRDTYRRLRILWQQWQKTKSPGLQKEIIEMMRPEAEYSALSRQFVFQWAWGRTGMARFWNKWKSLFESLRGDHENVTTAKRRATAKRYRNYEVELENYDLERGGTPSGLHLIDQTVERIEIKNLRAIRDLDIEVQSAAIDTAPWMLLLGENGTGKSTILQAMALAFAGATYRSRLDIDPASYVRRGCKSGYIRLYVRGFTAPLQLTFRNSGPRDKRLIGSDERPKIPVLAYGATRLLPRPDIRTYDGTSYARIDNLFNPFVPLANATEWLLGLKAAQFQHVARTLTSLLNLAPNVVLRRNRRRKRIEIPSLNVSSLAELSDGYQSMLALVVDIMMVMTKHFEAMEAAKGIVLLDEIGAHLHPRWQMRVVKNLRTTFPNIQFLATAHDPLCLRGIGDGEAVVLKKTANGKVFAVTDLPSVAGMRVEQLLTSEHFGLSSTIDPDLEDAFERYYELLRRGRLNKTDKDELEDLRQLLGRHRVMGSTRRERLMLEAIDRYLADSEMEPAGRLEAHTTLQGDFAKIFEKVSFEQ